MSFLMWIREGYNGLDQSKTVLLFEIGLMEVYNKVNRGKEAILIPVIDRTASQVLRTRGPTQ